jgi:hypothetical protein
MTEASDQRAAADAPPVTVARPGPPAPLRHLVHPVVTPGGRSPHRSDVPRETISTSAHGVLGGEQPKSTALAAQRPARVPRVDVWSIRPFTEGRRTALAATQPGTKAPPGTACPRPARLGAPSSGAPEVKTGTQRQIASTTSGHKRARQGTVAALVVMLVLGAGLAASLAWGRNQAGALHQRTQQLTATRAGLAATRVDLRDAQDRVARQLLNIGALDSEYSRTGAELAASQAALAKAQAQLAQTQDQLTQAQDRAAQAQDRAAQAQERAAQAQDRLGAAQDNLSSVEAHNASCQQGVSAGQEMFALEGTFIQIENDYVTAMETANAVQMQRDVTEMQVLDKQGVALSAAFDAALRACSAGGY